MLSLLGSMGVWGYHNLLSSPISPRKYWESEFGGGVPICAGGLPMYKKHVTREHPVPLSPFQKK